MVAYGRLVRNTKHLLVVASMFVLSVWSNKLVMEGQVFSAQRAHTHTHTDVSRRESRAAGDDCSPTEGMN